MKGLTNETQGLGGSSPSGVSVSDTWRVVLQADETLNDSDKVFTVPAGVEWQVLSLYAELTSTATAGDRQVEVQFQDSAGDVIAVIRAGQVQAAGLTRRYLFGAGLEPMANFLDTDLLTTPLPPSFLSAGQKVRIFDNNAVDAAADDLDIQIQYATREV